MKIHRICQKYVYIYIYTKHTSNIPIYIHKIHEDNQKHKQNAKKTKNTRKTLQKERKRKGDAPPKIKNQNHVQEVGKSWRQKSAHPFNRLTKHSKNRFAIMSFSNIHKNAHPGDPIMFISNPSKISAPRGPLGLPNIFSWAPWDPWAPWDSWGALGGEIIMKIRARARERPSLIIDLATFFRRFCQRRRPGRRTGASA